MTPVPLDLPLRPSEAAELANLVFDQAERKPLTDNVRNRIASRGLGLRFETIRPYFGSLERDPVHPSAYYLAVDGGQGEPLLLHLAPSTAPTSSIFYKPLLIGRLRRANGPEMVINAIPFGPSDSDQVEKFCAHINTAFQPRPQGLRAAITAGGDDPATALPAALDAYRAISKRTGKNLASLGMAAGGAAREFYAAAVWATIRAGWREGYNSSLELDLSSESLDAVKETVRQAPSFSTFGAEAGGLLHLQADPRHPAAWGDGTVEEKFERLFRADERGWVFDEFVRSFDTGDAVYDIASGEVVRLAVKFGPALRAVEQLQESIRQTRSQRKAGRSFDFELLLERAGAPATPQELIFCLHWLKQRGRAAQLAAPQLADGPDLARQLKSLAGAAFSFQARLSIRARADHTPEVLNLIARATVGRVNYKLAGSASDLAAHIPAVAAHFLG
ncbi:MAG TPA: hypothetical protein VMH81_39380 [Bryobacteraceae bacterium]|nr:hypothetical protein [Bryobacteraceae bacterium]